MSAVVVTTQAELDKALADKADWIDIVDGNTAKCKASKVVRACVEVDVHGDPVEVSS